MHPFCIVDLARQGKTDEGDAVRKCADDMTFVCFADWAPRTQMAAHRRADAECAQGRQIPYAPAKA